MAASSRYAAAGKTFAAKQAALADRLADAVLAEGLGELTLRRAAQRLGTSDRMLLYYFKTKADLVGAVLATVSDRQRRALAVPRIAQKRSPDALLLRAWSLVSDHQFVPFMRVWAEVASRGSQGEEPYRALAQATISGWLLWIESQLDLPAGRARRESAAAILAILEGATLLEMSKPGSAAGVTALLGRALKTSIRLL